MLGSLYRANGRALERHAVGSPAGMATGWLRPPQCSPQSRRLRLVDRPRRRVDRHPIVAPGRVEADEAVADIAEDARRVAIERVAPAARAGLLVAEDVAPAEGQGEFAG